MAKNRILVPVDGSTCSVHALEYAARRQRADNDVDIFVLNVQPSMRPSRTVTRELISEYQTRNAQVAFRPARAAIKRLNLNATCYTVLGNPSEAIVDFARKKKCSEIVMGNSGLGAVAGLMLGSVARKVVFLARTPVVLVK